MPDKGAIDGRGRFHFLGRTDDVVRLHGRNVWAGRIERLLEDTLPSAEAAVLLAEDGEKKALTAFLGGKAVTDRDPEALWGRAGLCII